MKYLGSITNNKDLTTKEYVDDKTEVVQTLTSGTKIGSVGGTDLYAPSGGGGGGATNWENGTGTESVKMVSATGATGDYSVAEGDSTVATGYASHAEGASTTASKPYSHTQNEGTRANAYSQTAIGTFNSIDAEPSTAVHPNGAKAYGNYAFIIGNGTGTTTALRSNALTVDWQGNLEASGNITDGSGNVLSNKANLSDIPTATSDLTNDSGFVPITETTNSIEFGEWKLVWGTVNMNSNSASGSGTFTAPYYNDTTITLGDDAFSGNPYVWCTLNGSATGTRTFSAHDVSASSFKIRMYSSHKNSTNFTCRWVAIGQK